MNVIGRSLGFFCLVVGLVAAAPLRAQEPYPNKPIRLVLGFAPGGISDVLGRALAQRLSTQLGQQVVVDNKPGAGDVYVDDRRLVFTMDRYTGGLYILEMTI